MGQFYDSVRQRFLRYVKIDTQSKANTGKAYSTPGQLNLAKMLRDELLDLGLTDVYLDQEACLVYAGLPSTRKDGGGLAIGLIAHLDTATEVTGKNVNPRVVEDYQGNKIPLDEENGIILDPEEFPRLLLYRGEDLVVTDGKTLLGADDKAAIAQLMTLVEYLQKHPEVEHGPIKIAFTPDEEVGGLARNLDLERFGAQLAYTIDGSKVGYYSEETFYATEAQLTIRGKNVHTAVAKGVLVNALEIASDFIHHLPPRERPQFTEGREGFYHPHTIQATVEEAKLYILIRDFDWEDFVGRQELIRTLLGYFVDKYPDAGFSLTFANGYENLQKYVKPFPFLIEALKEAISEAGITPQPLAFRGGTDGSALSGRGLPAPNLSAGYENAHSRYEFASVQALEKGTKILLHLVQKLAHFDADMAPAPGRASDLAREAGDPKPLPRESQLESFPYHTTAQRLGPLYGQTVAVFRAADKMGPSIEMFESMGAKVLALPLLGMTPILTEMQTKVVDQVFRNFAAYDFCFFSSTNAVKYFAELVEEQASLPEIRSLLEKKIILAIGPETAQACQEILGVKAETPKTYDTRGAIDWVRDRVVMEAKEAKEAKTAKKAKIVGPGECCSDQDDGQVGAKKWKFLLIRSNLGLKILPEELAQWGEVTDMVVYQIEETGTKEELEYLLKDLEGAYLIYSSSQMGRRFARLMGEDLQEVWKRNRVLSIGRTTTATLQELGARVDLEGAAATYEALKDGILADVPHFPADVL